MDDIPFLKKDFSKLWSKTVLSNTQKHFQSFNDKKIIGWNISVSTCLKSTMNTPHNFHDVILCRALIIDFEQIFVHRQDIFKIYTNFIIQRRIQNPVFAKAPS